MQVLYTIANILVVLSAIVMIITVLLQPGQRSGLGAIAGGAETFFGKNKAKSYEGKIELATKVASVVFVVMTVLMLALTTAMK